MKFYVFSFFIIFIFLGCQKPTPTMEKKYSFHNFNYTKEQIDFFEKEFESILKLENPNILSEYVSFYEKNASYFLNGPMKVKKLKNRINLLKSKKDETLLTLEKAKNQQRKEAIKIYNKLAKEGNIKAQRKLVEVYKINYPQIALELLEKLVAQEDIQSMKDYAAANIYMIRPVETQNLEKAFSTYKKLAQKGELSSIMRLGNMYEYGYHKEVAKQDKKKALQYYELAASRGYLIAQKKLYEIYSCKTCKPNRYNEKKAKELLAIIDKSMYEKENTKVSQSIKGPKKEEAKIVAIKSKQEEPKKEEAKTIAINYKQEENIIPEFQDIQCYDMKSAQAFLSNSCKQMILSFIEENPNISKIIISSTISEEDKLSLNKNLTDSNLKNILIDNLAEDRRLETIWFLKNNLKDGSVIHILTKNIPSIRNNGVLLKFYKKNDTKIKNEPNVIAITPIKKSKIPLLEKVACYDMKDAKTTLSDDCKKNILDSIKKHPNNSKIVVTSVVSKEDALYLDKTLKENTFLKPILKNLARQRVFQTINFLNKNLKDSSISTITTYHVTSQESPGVILKFY